LLKRIVIRVTILADTDTLMIYGDVGRNLLGPAAAVVVLNPITTKAQRFVRVAADEWFMNSGNQADSADLTET
jgi:hypothetical protein